MSEADDIDRWLSNQLDWFAHITEETVEAALIDFELPTTKSSRWLTANVRRAFFCTVGTEDEIAEYPGQLAVRKEIEAIADAIAVAKRLFADRSGWAESVFRRYSNYDDWDDLPDWDVPIEKEPDALDRLDDGKDGWWVESSNQMATASSDWRNFRKMVCGMLDLEDYLRAASLELCSRDEPTRWRDSERKKRRLHFANYLAVVFEETFSREATVNSWPDDDGKPRLGPWPDFFDRVARLALRIDKVPDLEGLLKTARRMRLDQQIAKRDGLQSEIEMDFARERLSQATKRLQEAGVNMIKRFATKKSP